MKSILIFLLLFATIKLVSQDLDSLKETVNSDFGKLDSNPDYLVPFRFDHKWGLYNIKTKKIAVPAKYNDLSFFTPNMSGRIKDLDFMISREGDVEFKEQEYDQEVYVIEEPIVEQSKNSNIQVKSEKGFNGFNTNEKGEITAFSFKYYYNRSRPAANIQAVTIQGQIYAIVRDTKSKKLGIIDSIGNTLPGFEFKYDAIIHNKLAIDKKNAWFFVMKKGGIWKLINDKGEYKKENLDVSNPSIERTLFGLGRMQVGKDTGIFDYTKMKWYVEPGKIDRFNTIRYSSSKDLDVQNPKHRKKAHIYCSFIKTNPSGRQIYYMDTTGKKHIPSEFKN